MPNFRRFLMIALPTSVAAEAACGQCSERWPRGEPQTQAGDAAVRGAAASTIVFGSISSVLNRRSMVGTAWSPGFIPDGWL